MNIAQEGEVDGRHGKEPPALQVADHSPDENGRQPAEQATVIVERDEETHGEVDLALKTGAVGHKIQKNNPKERATSCQ